jgi:hypothetical protein
MISAVEECPSYGSCEAPLCPLYEHKELSVWYPDEAICNKIGRPEWVKKQRRIQKRAIDRDSHYTIEMLGAIKAVTPKTRGLDPEGKRSEEVFIKRRTPTTIPDFGENTPLRKAKEHVTTPQTVNPTGQQDLFNWHDKGD